jgi:hypothetical protein
MTISTTGTGERNLYVSYISEVPIWKTTYRIVLPLKAQKKPLLQGWATVDNTVGKILLVRTCPKRQVGGRAHFPLAEAQLLSGVLHSN